MVTQTKFNMEPENLPPLQKESTSSEPKPAGPLGSMLVFAESNHPSNLQFAPEKWAVGRRFFPFKKAYFHGREGTFE